MIEAPSIALAFAAGFVSFVSPCCLPLVPGYLAAIAGVSGEEPRRRWDPGVARRSLLFIASFSSVFILLGLTATALGALLFDSQQVLNKIAGGAIVLMGLLFVASVFVTRLNRDWRPRNLIERAGRGGPVLAGFAFAIAWTPCVGPTLGAILGLAATQRSGLQGAGLLAVYSAGLGLPFFLSAVVFTGARRRFSFFRRHHMGIQVASGLVLIAMGALVISGQLFRLNIEAQQALDRFGLNFFQSV